MFKRIVIEFTEPICNCEEQDLGWNVLRDAKAYPVLSVSCKKCESSISVGHSKFVANYAFEKPYPKVITKVGKILQFIKGGKDDVAQ